MDMNVVVEDERITENRELSLFTSADSRTEVLILSDSGANVRMTPWKEDLKNTRKMHVWEQGATAGTGNGRYAITPKSLG